MLVALFLIPVGVAIAVANASRVSLDRSCLIDRDCNRHLRADTD